jgi:hypothetical protein
MNDPEHDLPSVENDDNQLTSMATNGGRYGPHGPDGHSHYTSDHRDIPVDRSPDNNGPLGPPPLYEDVETPPPPYSPSFRIFDIPEAPPDYFTVVGLTSHIQDARREADGCCSFLLKIKTIIIYISIITVLLIMLISVPGTMFSIGVAYYGQCSIEPNIPIYLIVAGICGVLKSIETLIKQFIVCIKCSCLTRWRNSKYKYLFIVWRVIDLIVNVFLLGWSITGSYWIFHVYGELQAAMFDESLCNPVLYKFAFGMTVSCYIVMVLTCCCVCGCSLCRIRSTNSGRSEGRRRGERREGDTGEGGGERDGDHGSNGDPPLFAATNQTYFNQSNVNSTLTNSHSS